MAVIVVARELLVASVDMMGRTAVAVAACVVLKGAHVLVASCGVTKAAEKEVTVEEAVVGFSRVMSGMFGAAEVILVDAAAPNEVNKTN